MKNTLFYDGRCPLCSKEMTLLKRLKNSSLVLVDIHEEDSLGLMYPKTSNELLSVLHLKTAEQEWVTGIDASVMAWSHTKYGFLYKPLRWPILKQLSDYIYAIWARRRACKLGYCENDKP